MADNSSYAMQEILQEVKSGNVKSQLQLNKLKHKVAASFQLQKMPSNAELIQIASPQERKLFQGVLSRKPTRILSGVTVIAIMTKPYDCVGKCIYCPSSLVEGKKTPKSYTGLEPSTMRGLMFNFNPYKIVENRLQQYREVNNYSPKLELILQGGTFTALPYSHQKYFIKRCYDAVLERNTGSLKEAKLLCEHSKNRVVGLTIETRPDWCGKKEINRMLDLGTTRVELGVQNPDDHTYKMNVRGHTVNDVVNATQLLKDSCFKVAYHLMPGMYGSSYENDLENFKKVFSQQEFMPDMIKIYPCLVMPNTPLYRLWKQGKFEPLSTEMAAEMVAELKRFIPRHVRIMRIQRDIPTTVISGGVKNSNLRQIVEQKRIEKGIKCNCIRCREAGLKSYHSGKEFPTENAKLLREDYAASNGNEIFLSFEETSNDALFGFCRLRIPDNPFRKEITGKTGLIRELHIYSKALELSENPGNNEMQHRGFGKALIKEAERIAEEEFGCNKMAIISGLGVKEYYRKQLGYEKEGPYVSKALR